MGEGFHGDSAGSFGTPEPTTPRPRGFQEWERNFAPPEGAFHGLARGRTRDARITKRDGTVVFALDAVEAPEGWTDEAVNIAAQKYLVRNEDVTERSVFDMIDGVVKTIGDAGEAQGYFAAPEARRNFCDDLAYLLIHQMGAFNSPVWFNVRRWHVYGIPGGPGNWAWDAARGEVVQVARGYERPQCSACQPYHALVNTEEGLVPIGDIVTHNRVGLRVQDGDGLTTIQAVKSNGTKKVYRVRLADGFQVEATGDHLVCAHAVRRTVREEWRRVDALRPGMFMRVYSRDGGATQRTSPDEAIAEAALAGWLQCDGFVGQYEEGTNTSLTVETLSVNADEHAWVCGLQAAVFPDVQWNETAEAVADPALDFRRRRAYGERFRTFVEAYDLLTRNPHMRVPPRIFHSADDVVVAYLRSLFQADGYVSLRENGAIIGLSKCSRDLIQGVQLLLARLGIYSRVIRKEEKRADRYDQWCLTIATLSERSRFAEKIGFISGTKQSKLDESLDMDGRDAARIRYVPIESIEVVGERPVYDIQTASGKYLSGSVLVHNCFIQRVDDSLVDDGGIADFLKSEMRLFKYGSGSGANFSGIREKNARLSPGGRASGLMSFLPVFDRAAGSVASGGTSRRAAKMVILDVDHPEIFEFIRWKMVEERKAQALIAAGFSGGMEGEAYTTVSGQNANNSVRVTDAFMRAVEADADVALTSRVDGRVVRTVKARAVWDAIADAAWHCADPGVQFHDTINDWHTTPNAGPIRASNPCSEYMHLDNSACNLASLNLVKFLGADGAFDYSRFTAACYTFAVAQDILVDLSSYPTKAVAEGAHRYRQLGLGYANLGTLLMLMGLPYDSEAGRREAARITSCMTASGYLASVNLAAALEPFEGFAPDREGVLRVLRKHAYTHEEVLGYTSPIWRTVIDKAATVGVRNAQMTVLAPTGTIGFLMSCKTTGIEPNLAHVQYKTLAGGGDLVLVNDAVRVALERLGYGALAVEEICAHVEATGGVSGCEHIRDEHVAIFDTAMPSGSDQRSLSVDGHILMMAAVQPFLSGAISKTVNLPADTTVEGVAGCYYRAWKLGLKAVALYRDGCKSSQPVTTKKVEPAANYTPALVSPPGADGVPALDEFAAPAGTEPDLLKALAASAGRSMAGDPPFKRGQRKLPKERRGTTWALKLDEHKLYIRSGEYPDGTPGEIFIDLAKEGSTLGGLAGMWAKAVSLCLQYGVPLEELVETFTYTRFEPWGRVLNHPTIKTATSIADLAMRVLAVRYLGRTDLQHVQPDALDEGHIPPPTHAATPEAASPLAYAPTQPPPAPPAGDTPTCPNCGALTRRTGTCHACPQCGTSLGCS